MKLTTFALATLATPLTTALPTTSDGQSTRPRELIQPQLFPILQRYTKFAVASLATFVYGFGKCPSPPFSSTLVRTVSNATTDTQFAIFQDDAAKEFIVSFPGTDSLQDGVTDLNYPLTPFTSAPGCTACQVHQGLLISWRSVQFQLTTALDELRAQRSGYATIIVGHSLGGGLASLAYTDLKANNIPIKIAYTMGSLRVGNQAYADFTDRLSGASDTQLGTLIRITHGIDGVPGLPLNVMGFKHTRTEIYEVNNLLGMQTAATTYRCFGQEALDCNRGTTVQGINQDHLWYTGVSMTTGESCYST